VVRADVFVSASTATNRLLSGRSNGDWVSWYATFATAPLILGYSPKSRFAKELASKPWQEVLAEPGFRLGRTDPRLDPKGELSVRALHQVGLDRLAAGTKRVFPEETLAARLQAGQLDAGFFYASEALGPKIRTITLDPVQLAARYTVTVLNRAPNPAGAAAFVRYLLGPQGSALMRHSGLTLLQPPQISGERGKIPAALRAALTGT
jgi:molybdate/tungstate transport system substrate-binding protein